MPWSLLAWWWRGACCRVYDQRVLTQVVLNLGSSDTNGDAIMEDPDTEVAVMSLYATLGRLHEMPMEVTAAFSYAEVRHSLTHSLTAVSLTCSAPTTRAEG